MNVKSDKDRKDRVIRFRVNAADMKRLYTIKTKTGISWSPLLRAMIASCSVPGATRAEMLDATEELIGDRIKELRRQEEETERKYKGRRSA